MGDDLNRKSLKHTTYGRSVMLTSANPQLRSRLRHELTAMRWQVREATGGAEALELLEERGADAMVLDHTLPDLEVTEFTEMMRIRYPVMDLLRIDGIAYKAGTRSPRRNELLHALRQTQESEHGFTCIDENTAWVLPLVGMPQQPATRRMTPGDEFSIAAQDDKTHLCEGNAPQSRKIGNKDSLETGQPTSYQSMANGSYAAVSEIAEFTQIRTTNSLQTSIFDEGRLQTWGCTLSQPLPEMVGESPLMMELARLIRLVAPRLTTVLIEGETGTGKELVAHAVHQLSTRSNKPFVVLNCAAIPESLLEAELFGHTRGAFTGAVQSRTGRIEAAHGGTLFLDEIGEMPLALQAKMLRFLESGELQRVGNNETVQVDVRVVAATHEPLQQRASEHFFRLDLYHRLAVFPVVVPALRERMEDVLLLATHLLGKLGEEMPVKRLSAGAATRLMEHHWPGNVRELAHVLERATILAEDRREITLREIQF